VLIVVVAALGVRTGLLVGIAIPGSFLTGVLVLALLGFTVNIVVLFALILAVGMLVDGAIVVTEFADRRMREGAPPREAYAAAAKRMAWPITASTATTLAAFMPLLFWPGVVGEFMKFLPITLIATLTASLAMALIFVPTLGAHFGRPIKGATQPEFTTSGAIGGFTGAYVRVLRVALRHPAKVMALAVVTLIAAWALYLNFGRGIEFFPDVEAEQAIIQVHARGNLSIDEQDRLVSQVEREVLAMQRERGEFRAINTVAGEHARRDDRPEDIIGTIRLEFVEWDRRRPADTIIGDILARGSGFAGIKVESRKAEAGPPVGKPIQIRLSSRWPETIPPVVEAIRNHMDGMSGLVDVEDSRPVPGIEWEISVDRAEAAKFGADVAGVGSVIQLVTKGLKFSEYRPDDTDEEIDIVARFPPEWRTLDQLDRIRVQTDLGLVPISSFVERTARQRTGELFRVDGLRTMTVKAEVEPGVLADTKVREIQAWLTTQDFDPRVDIAFKGEDEEQKSARAFLSTAFLFALAVMGVILVTQFNSFYSTFLILSAVVMSTIGVMLGLLVIGQPFGIVMSGIGVIALAGIVVNNNIVLIDTHDRLRAEIADPMEAILLTGAQRLRPVLLTAATTILGVLPMTLQINIDFVTREVTHGAPSTQWWMQISTAIAFGLGFATLLTLIVTPSALMLRANMAAWLARRRHRLATAEATE
jgi:multidrug efflux pump